jgi:Fe-S-cluster containining protein
VIKTCPGDCCRVIHLQPRLEHVIESLVTTTPKQYNFDPDEAEKLIRLVWPATWEWGTYECEAFDRVNRSCTTYEKRPFMCSSFASEGGCQNCSYDARYPDVPGSRYPAIEDTGIFCTDYQPERPLREERQR